MEEKYDIKEARTLELLCANLSYDEAIEALWLYQDLYGYDVIMVHSEEYLCSKAKHKNEATEYKIDYIHYFAELQLMGNLL